MLVMMPLRMLRHSGSSVMQQDRKETATPHVMSVRMYWSKQAFMMPVIMLLHQIE